MRTADDSCAPASGPALPRLDWHRPLTWGGLAQRSRAPLFDRRLSYTPGRIVALPVRGVDVTVTYSHVNIWAQMPHYTVDGEWSRLGLKAAMGLGAQVEVSLEVAALRRSGGYLDGIIEGFHDLFGITQARRQNYPRNRLWVETMAGRHVGLALNDASAGVGVANPSIGVKKQLWPRHGSRAAADLVSAVDLVASIPMGAWSESFGSRQPTFMGDIAIQQRLSARWQVAAAWGLLLSPGIAELYGMPMSEVQKFLSVALILRLATNVALVAQYLNQDGSVETADFTPMERTTHEFSLGVQWAPWHTDAWLFEAGIIENTVHDANTPDFGYMLGLRRRLG